MDKLLIIEGDRLLLLLDLLRFVSGTDFADSPDGQCHIGNPEGDSNPRGFSKDRVAEVLKERLRGFCRHVERGDGPIISWISAGMNAHNPRMTDYYQVITSAGDITNVRFEISGTVLSWLHGGRSLADQFAPSEEFYGVYCRICELFASGEIVEADLKS